MTVLAQTGRQSVAGERLAASVQFVLGSASRWQQVSLPCWGHGRARRSRMIGHGRGAGHRQVSWSLEQAE